jgi:hypothetical protein
VTARAATVPVPAPTAAWPADLDAWRQSLVLAADGDRAPPWLDAAAADPAAFWRAIAPALLTAAGGAARSSPFERYDLFADLGARHAAGRRAAWAEHDDAAGVRRWTYAALADDARSLATAWRAAGLAAGDCVAIVASPSPERLAALLAAWQLGAVAAPLPAWGPSYLRARIAALAPAAVVADAGAGLALGALRRLPLRAPPADDGCPGHRYAPDEVALRVFSPLGATPLAPLDVGAERLYLGALRDGALLLGLGPGLAVCAPGCSEVREGLALLLAALATGGQLVDLGLDAAIAQPTLLARIGVDVLGVAPELRDALIAADGAGARPARWFRSPAAPIDPPAWQRLARALPRSLASTYLASPAAGGAVVVAPWRRELRAAEVLPAPGLAWQLLDAGGSGQAATGAGVLVDADLDPGALGCPVLSLGRGDGMWLTALGAHRDGERLPVDEIAAVVTGAFDVVWTCGVIDDGRDGSAVLVVFVRPDAGATAGLASALGEVLAAELAPHLVPDRIELFTIAPRLDRTGSLDRSWCQGQYASGRLTRKQREALFVEVARLRSLAQPES